MPGDWRGTLWTLLVTFCVVIVRCTKNLWSPCMYSWWNSWKFLRPSLNCSIPNNSTIILNTSHEGNDVLSTTKDPGRRDEAALWSTVKGWNTRRLYLSLPLPHAISPTKTDAKWISCISGYEITARCICQWALCVAYSCIRWKVNFSWRTDTSQLPPPSLFTSQKKRNTILIWKLGVTNQRLCRDSWRECKCRGFRTV
jgi:hypothetical protein